ncbi:TPA: hypothetical protein ACH3X1_005474 [Trebouxia sp. C0004]
MCLLSCASQISFPDSQAKYRKTCFVNSTQPGLKLPSCRLSTLLAPTQGHSQMQAVQQEIDRVKAEIRETWLLCLLLGDHCLRQAKGNVSKPIRMEF